MRALLLLFVLLLPGSALAQTDQAARAALPDALRQSGVLRVATSLQWPPFDFTGANGQPDGLDIRVVTALAARLGLKAEFTDVKFPAIVPGVSTGRFDLGIDQIADTAERRKVVQFVDFYRSALGLLAPSGRARLDPNALCGHSLALTQGSLQVGIAKQLSDRCVAAGQPPIGQIFFPDSADTYLAVANGRADGFLTDRAVGIYIAQHNGKLAVMDGTVPGTSNVAGIVVAKGDDALENALKLALKGMVQDGSFAAILRQYGVPDAGLTAAEIDAPPGTD